MHLGKLLTPLFLVAVTSLFSQPIGSVKTEEYTANFEKKKSLDALPPYEGDVQIPIQILKSALVKRYTKCTQNLKMLESEWV